MKTTIMIKQTILLIFLILINFNIRLAEARNNATEPNKPVFTSRGRRVVSNTKGIEPVAHQEMLDILEQTEKQNTEELKNRFNQFTKEQKLETIAYCFKENKQISEALWKIIQEPSLRDKSLVPYLVEEMPKLKGRAMMLAARSAILIPDINLMEPLLNYAVESDYQEEYTGNIGRYTETIHMSAFEEAANAINIITNNRMGKILPEKSKETLIQEWRVAWPEIKQEMQKEKEEKEREISPIVHKEILDIIAKANDVADKSEYSKAIKNYKFNDILETVVYVLDNGLYSDSFFSFCMMQDKRLIPFIAKALKDSNGEKRLMAALLAERNPDPSLLPFLMQYALNNDYVKTYRYGPEDEHFFYNSVFAAAAYAISEITNGKIGSRNYSYYSKEIPEEEKQALIEQWRNIYDEILKQNYEPSKLILPSTPIEPNKPENKTPDDKIVP